MPGVNYYYGYYLDRASLLQGHIVPQDPKALFQQTPDGVGFAFAIWPNAP